MKIECKLKREGGTRIKIFGEDVHFKPDELGRHVADVRSRKACERLLSISEGYRPVLDDVDDEGSEELSGDLNAGTSGGLEPGASTEGLDDPISLTDEEVEGDEGEEPETEEEGLYQHPENGDEGEEEDGDEINEEAVRAEWQALFGKKPHHAKKVETLLREIEEAEKDSQ